MQLNHETIINWLQEDNQEKLQGLYKKADEIRKEEVGDEIHLRGLVEFSNSCSRNCHYCGIRASRKDVNRYRMNKDEILSCSEEAASFGYGSVVLQSGEDYGITTDFMAELIRDIKNKTNLAITLSLGEKSDDELQQWKDAGADRYLLRFETSDMELYNKIHPDTNPNRSRIQILKNLEKMGYEVGSGVMIGIPEQTWDTLANDIMLFKELDIDMIGVGPYIPHPDTPLANNPEYAKADKQVPNTEEITYKVLSLIRILCPKVNIPSTTALATLNKDTGRENGLCCGANVLMPNITPRKYRQLYEIYPSKACLNETDEEQTSCMRERIEAIGRKVGNGRGDSCNFDRFPK